MASDRKVQMLRPAAARRTGDGPISEEDLWEGLAGAPTLEAFAAPFLELQSRLIKGIRQAVLVLGPAQRGPFSLAATWPDDQAPARALIDGAERAVETRKDLIAGALPGSEGESARGGSSSAGDSAETSASAPDAEAALPSSEPSSDDVSIVAHPLILSGKLHGAIVVQVDARSEVELRGLLKQLRWGSGWLDSLLRRQGVGRGLSRKARVELVPDLLATTLEHDSFEGAARSFVTELATLLACDRVSIGFVRRGRCEVRAISHASHHGKKTNLIRAIEAAMDEAVDQQASVVHPPPDGISAMGSHAHEELSKQRGADAICSVPIAQAGEIHGAITFERPADQAFDARTVELCEAAAMMVGPLLEVMRRDDRWLGAKAWESARRWLERLYGPRHVVLKLVASLVVLLVLFFAVAKGDYRVTADTVLEPAVVRAAVASFEGYVEQAPVRAGDIVRAGDLLATLDDRDLTLERIKWTSQQEQLRKQYRQALASRDAARVEIFASSLGEAEAELARIDERLARTRLLAPLDGVVIQGDLTQQLGAPVEKGAVLFELAPLDAYRVILEVDESDIAEIAPDQTGRIVFASLPDESFDFTVNKITPVATAEEGKNYFRVEAQLDAPSEDLRPGIEGVAKVEIDRRSLIWIWTHDATEWLRLRLWKWMP